MADKTEFLQAIDDAILDADSLERFINGSDSETVLTRLSAEYPTIRKALKELFENGGIAGRFKTLAELQASALVDGDYALVADDTDGNNGIYIKKDGDWVKSEFDFTRIARAVLSERIGTVKSARLHPVVVDDDGNSPLWLDNGAVSFAAISDESLDIVKDGVGIGSLDIDAYSLPVIVDSDGNVPLWIDKGTINFAAISQGAVDKIASKLKLDKLPNNYQLPIISDGRTLTKFKSKVARIKAGQNVQASIVLTGDSWIEHERITSALKSMTDASYGKVGSGWINLGYENRQLDGIEVSKSGSWAYRDMDVATGYPDGKSPDGFVLKSTTAGDKLNISNLENGDSLTLFLGKASGAFEYSVNGEPAISGTATSDGDVVQSVEISLSGVSDVELTTVSGTVVVFGALLRKATGAGVEINKIGNGSTTGRDYLKVSPQAQANFVHYLSPDLVIIVLGTNDYRKGHSVSDYKLGISAIIDGYRTNNDDCGVILVAPSDSNATPKIPLVDFRDAVLEVAQEKDCEFYNLHDDWSKYAIEQNNEMWADSLHVNDAGAYRIASKIFNTFLEI